MPDPPPPVMPCDEAGVDDDRVVETVTAESLKKYPSTQERQLDRRDRDRGPVLAPDVDAEEVRQDEGEEAVDVEEDEDGDCGAEEEEDEVCPVWGSSVRSWWWRHK